MGTAALNFFTGLGRGFQDALEKRRQDDRTAARDAREQQLFDARMADITKARQDRTDLEEANQPQEATPVAGPKTASMLAAEGVAFDPTKPSQAPSENPLGYVVGSRLPGARFYASQGIAQADAAAQNTDDARRSRMARLAASGNALASTAIKDAANVRASDLQAEASRLQIDKAKRDEAADIFDRGIRNSLQTGGAEGLAKFMSDSAADGKGGQVQFKAVMSQDGKSFQIHRVNDDGGTAPVGGSFTNDESGFATAGLMLSRAVPEKDKLAHLTQVKENERKAEHDKGMLGVAQKNAQTQADYRADQASHNRVMAGIAQAELGLKRQAQAASASLPSAVRMQYETLDTELKQLGQAISQAQANGTWDAKSPGAQDLLTRQKAAIAKANALLAPYVKGGKADAPGRDPLSLFGDDASVDAATKTAATSVMNANSGLSPAVALAALELAKDRSNVKVARDPSTGQSFEVVMVNGKPIRVSGALTKTDPGTPPPGRSNAAGLAAEGIPVQRTAQEAALDTARATLDTTRAKLHTFGLAQRQADPTAYAQAQAAYQAAQQAEQTALAEYQGTVAQAVRPAFAQTPQQRAAAARAAQAAHEFAP